LRCGRCRHDLRLRPISLQQHVDRLARLRVGVADLAPIVISKAVPSARVP
jgi:hypothetical protein